MPRKLHEYLGSQKQVVAQADKLRSDLAATFGKKDHLFTEKKSVYAEDGENKEPVTESQSSLQTTVPKELKWLTGIIAKALDSEATIDEGNTKARGNVTLDDGKVLLPDVPATQLLQLDKRLGELLTFIQSVPTLDPAKGYVKDTNRGTDVWKAREVRKRRTKKEAVVITLSPATEHHPANAQLVQKDVEVGTIVENEWSGLTTPAIKSKMLERVEELRRAVKQARARANDVEVKEVSIGKSVLDYVFGPAYEA